ncbi:MAG TPA: glycosyltransferase family 2 protein [Herpetosiphonaceae bacterium]
MSESSLQTMASGAPQGLVDARKWHVIIQIPCLNEEETLPAVLADIPADLPHVRFETLLIDDGSTDRSVEIARELGVNYIVQHRGRKGLPTAFQSGIDAALKLGADIIVNTDGDHQYPGSSIPDLVAPIIEGRADIVIGDRQTANVAHFSRQKKILQQIGSWVVRAASDTDVPDAPSGFRAYAKEAALRLYVTSEFSYTIENLIQAGKRRLNVTHISITTKPTRPSRLHRGNWNFVKRQGATIIRTYAQYEPLKTFTYLALPFLLIGAALLLRFLIAYFFDPGLTFQRYLQSVFIGGILMLSGILTFFIGILADLSGSNRRLNEEVLYRLRNLEVDMATKYRELERQIEFARPELEEAHPPER